MGRREGAREAPCHNLPIGNHHTVRARQERREIFMAVRLLLEGVSLILKRAPDTHTHTQNKRGCADEAQYCRGARYARKSRTYGGKVGKRDAYCSL